MMPQRIRRPSAVLFLALGLSPTRATLGAPVAAAALTEPTNRPGALAPGEMQESDGPTRDNFLIARDILRRSLEAYGSMAGRLAVAELDLGYRGSAWEEGPLASPDERITLEMVGRFRVSAFWDAAVHTTQYTSPAGQSRHSQVLTSADQVFETALGAPRGEELEGPRERDAWVRTWSFLPHLILERIDRSASNLRHLGRVEYEGRPHALLSYCDLDGRTRSLLIDAQTWLLTRVEYLRHCPGRGDCLDSLDFARHKVIGGMQIPQFVHSVEIDRDSRVERQVLVSAVSYGRRALRSDFYLPQDRIPGAQPELLAQRWAAGLTMPVERAAAQAQVHELGQGLWMLRFPVIESQVVVATFADHSVVLEAPLDSAIGATILERVLERTPEQPVRYLVTSHHHPRSCWGLRPFVEAGVTLVTTPGNVEALTRLATRSHAIEPDSQEVRRQRPRFLVVSDRHVFEDESQRLELIEVGASLGHTDEYLLGYFSAQRLLCSGDLSCAGARLRRAPHAGALVEIIRALELGVDQVVDARAVEGGPLTTSLTALRSDEGEH